MIPLTKRPAWKAPHGSPKVERDVWKIEGLDQRKGCEHIVIAGYHNRRDKVGCIILGRGEDERKVRLANHRGGSQKLYPFRRGPKEFLGAARQLPGKERLHAKQR
jgi:hypothetical protein